MILKRIDSENQRRFEQSPIEFHKKVREGYLSISKSEKRWCVINADQKSTRVAASLCKLDLVSEMVFEFPELQGVIGCNFAKKAGYKKSIADACSEHYLPKGSLDEVPRKPISIALALADRVDTICNFYSPAGRYSQRFFL